MPNQLRVIKLDLEDLVVGARERGRSLEQIRDEANTELARRGLKATISKPAVERYLASLDEASVAPAHQPQLAQRNAEFAIDFGGRLVDLDKRLHQWLIETDEAVTPMRGVRWDPVNQAPAPTKQAERHAGELYDSLKDALEYMPDRIAADVVAWTLPSEVLIPDWNARTRVAAEVRKLLELYADVMERVANAQHVQEFQRIIFDTIRDADGPTATKILDALRELRVARQAGMLGLED